MIVYWRSDKEMTARVEEHYHAVEEGVEFHWLTNPVEVLGDEDGWVTGLKCISMELGEPDESGRARAAPIEGSESVIPVDNVVLSIGNRRRDSDPCGRIQQFSGVEHRDLVGQLRAPAAVGLLSVQECFCVSGRFSKVF